MKDNEIEVQTKVLKELETKSNIVLKSLLLKSIDNAKYKKKNKTSGNPLENDGNER